MGLGIDSYQLLPDNDQAQQSVSDSHKNLGFVKYIQTNGALIGLKPLEFSPTFQSPFLYS